MPFSSVSKSISEGQSEDTNDQLWWSKMFLHPTAQPSPSCTSHSVLCARAGIRLLASEQGTSAAAASETRAASWEGLRAGTPGSAWELQQRILGPSANRLKGSSEYPQQTVQANGRIGSVTPYFWSQNDRTEFIKAYPLTSSTFPKELLHAKVVHNKRGSSHRFCCRVWVTDWTVEAYTRAPRKWQYTFITLDPGLYGIEKADQMTTVRSYFREEQDWTNYLRANIQTQPPRDSGICILQVSMAFLWLSKDVKEYARKWRWEKRRKERTCCCLQVRHNFFTQNNPVSTMPELPSQKRCLIQPARSNLSPPSRVCEIKWTTWKSKDFLNDLFSELIFKKILRSRIMGKITYTIQFLMALSQSLGDRWRQTTWKRAKIQSLRWSC